MSLSDQSTNEEIARHCGVHWVTVSRWRNGKNKPRNKLVLRKLVKLNLMHWFEKKGE